jgi:hypothetical protein
VELCEACCAGFRANAVEYPSLGASRITLRRPPEIRITVDTGPAETALARAQAALDRLATP